MTLELKEGCYARLERDIQKIESLAWDAAYTGQNMGDMVQGYLRITQAVRMLMETLRDAVLMVPDAAPAGNGEKGAAV